MNAQILASTLALARARLAAEWLGPRGQTLPVAPLLFHMTVASVLCGLARDVLPPYPYCILALSIPLIATAIPLLGELAPLLRADPASEWLGGLPIGPLEVRAARVLCLGAVLTFLGLGSILPAALLAPSKMGWGVRALLIVCGLAQTAVVAATLLAIQALLGRRSEALLLVLQTVLLCAAILGTVLGLSLLSTLATWTPEGATASLFPPAWFASLILGGPRAAALVALVLALSILALAPFPPAPLSRRTTTPLALLLRPARRLATRVWVKRDERASFDFVYDALPAEPDFVTRTYPLVALPLAFLLLGSRTGGEEGEGLIALLLFAPSIYLPVLLAHVPATSTPQARWLIDTSPLDPAQEAGGARKAVAVRFLVPLFVVLFGLAWSQGGLDLALRIAPIAAACTLFALRWVWDLVVTRPPLSTTAADLGTAWANDFTSILMGLAVVSTLVAIVAWRLVPSPLVGFGVAAVVLALEFVPGLARKSRAIGEGSD